MIGILTFHRAYNYGAILQAFALQKKIKELGYNSEIIDYVSIEKRKQNKLFRFQADQKFTSNISKFVKDIYRAGKNKKFDQFMKEEMVLSSQEYFTFEQMQKMDSTRKYDTYIVGSDQVWNIDNNKRDKTFVLSFCNDNRKKCSYAASIGSAEFDGEMKKLYQAELCKFRVLAVREESTIEKYDFLKENGAIVTIDPTLLLNSSDYMRIASPRIIKERYAFLYTIEEERNLRRYARNFCKEKGLILIDSKKSIPFFTHSDPRDFLSFILHAEYVFTNSFHGTAFSIIMEKQFATEVHTRYRLNNRSLDLLSQTSLTDRDIDDNSFKMNKSIDFANVNKKVKQLRMRSVTVLKQIVSEKN